MSDPFGGQDDAATQLSEEEREGLIPSYITLRDADRHDFAALLEFVRS